MSQGWEGKARNHEAGCVPALSMVISQGRLVLYCMYIEDLGVPLPVPSLIGTYHQRVLIWCTVR